VHTLLDVIAGAGVGLAAAASEFLVLYYFHPV
jgi:membrane-associated phospholipid phosphatase